MEMISCGRAKKLDIIGCSFSFYGPNIDIIVDYGINETAPPPQEKNRKKFLSDMPRKAHFQLFPYCIRRVPFSLPFATSVFTFLPVCQGEVIIGLTSTVTPRATLTPLRRSLSSVNGRLFQ